MVDLATLVSVVGFSMVANLVSKEFTYVPILCAILDAIDPMRGAFVGAVSVILLGSISKAIKTGRQ